MTYVTEQTSAELAAHMRRLRAMPGWHEPLADRLWQEVQALQRDLAALRDDIEAQIRIASEEKRRACELAETALKVAVENVSLHAQIERYQALCAATYQLAGTMNAPVRFLDALSDGANGELEARAKTEDLLPVSPDEVGEFLSDDGAEYRRDAERYRWLISKATVSCEAFHWNAIRDSSAVDAAIDAALAQQKGEL